MLLLLLILYLGVGLEVASRTYISDGYNGGNIKHAIISGIIWPHTLVIRFLIK